jgi:hypothetical protein
MEQPLEGNPLFLLKILHSMEGIHIYLSPSITLDGKTIVKIEHNQRRHQKNTLGGWVMYALKKKNFVTLNYNYILSGKYSLR